MNPSSPESKNASDIANRRPAETDRDRRREADRVTDAARRAEESGAEPDEAVELEDTPRETRRSEP